MHLSGLFIYPVKSLRGIAVSSARLDDLGLVGDRRFLVVDDQGQFLTQRTLPRMALIETAWDRDTLTLSHPDHGSTVVSLDANGDPVQVQVWRDSVTAEDCGDAVAAWLSDCLQHSCRLVRIGPSFDRTVIQGKDGVSFADGYPLLVIGDTTLADLNNRIQEHGEEPVPMDRFRSNLVISGSAPFAEDGWDRFQIGEVIFRTGGPCARCTIPTTDQQTAERGKEPLRTLATYRRDADDPNRINFGQNLINESKQGSLQLGDKICLL